MNHRTVKAYKQNIIKIQVIKINGFYFVVRTSSVFVCLFAMLSGDDNRERQQSFLLLCYGL